MVVHPVEVDPTKAMSVMPSPLKSPATAGICVCAAQAMNCVLEPLYSVRLFGFGAVMAPVWFTTCQGDRPRENATGMDVQPATPVRARSAWPSPSKSPDRNCAPDACFGPLGWANSMLLPLVLESRMALAGLEGMPPVSAAFAVPSVPSKPVTH
jgi:hypothetical protein